VNPLVEYGIDQLERTLGRSHTGDLYRLRWVFPNGFEVNVDRRAKKSPVLHVWVPWPAPRDLPPFGVYLGTGGPRISNLSPGCRYGRAVARLSARSQADVDEMVRLLHARANP